jgi:hypothetical protein
MCFDLVADIDLLTKIDSFSEILRRSNILILFNFFTKVLFLSFLSIIVGDYRVQKNKLSFLSYLFLMKKLFSLLTTF